MLNIPSRVNNNNRSRSLFVSTSLRSSPSSRASVYNLLLSARRVRQFYLQTREVSFSFVRLVLFSRARARALFQLFPFVRVPGTLRATVSLIYSKLIRVLFYRRRTSLS